MSPSKRFADIVLPAFAALAASTAFAATGPCDIFQAGGTPCVAAHSTVRALYGAYAGNLYQVRRSSDNTTKDIGTLAPGGAANSALQDQFCTGTTCVITILFDQSGHGNFMEYQGPGSSVTGSASAATATNESFNLSGRKVYSLYIKPGNTYWRDGHLTGIPTGTAPEGMYMVTSGTHVNSGCCFDYGNSETTRKADAAGAMDAIYFGTSCWFASSHPCSGTGPWVQADLEWGLYPGGSQSWNTKQVSFPNKFVTAMLKNNGTTRFALKGANAQSGNLTTLWDGSLPSGYNPMKKQGAIILGSGGDCCRVGGGVNQSQGTFYEGAMVAGYPTDATDDALQANIVAAGYGSATISVSSRHLSAPASFHYDARQARELVDFSLENPGDVRLDITDLGGRRIATVRAGRVAAGPHQVVWDARTATPGVYLARLSLDRRVASAERFVVGE